MDQNIPQNVMVIVDTSPQSANAFNAMAFHTKITGNRDRVFILNLCSIKTGLFVTSEKREAHLKKEETCAKAVLSYYGKRAEAFELHYTLLGAFAEKDNFVDKIRCLIERFEVGTLYVGNTSRLPADLPLKSNVYRINRATGYRPDHIYLQQSIQKEDISKIQEFFDEKFPTDFELSWDDKTVADFIFYRYTDKLDLSESERAAIVSEILGTVETSTFSRGGLPSLDRSRDSAFVKETASKTGTEDAQKASFNKDIYDKEQEGSKGAKDVSGLGREDDETRLLKERERLDKPGVREEDFTGVGGERGFGPECNTSEGKTEREGLVGGVHEFELEGGGAGGVRSEKDLKEQRDDSKETVVV